MFGWPDNSTRIGLLGFMLGQCVHGCRIESSVRSFTLCDHKYFTDIIIIIIIIIVVVVVIIIIIIIIITRLWSFLIPIMQTARTVISQSVQRLVTDWTIGVLEFDFRRELGIFLFTTVSRTTLGPTQPPIQLVAVALSLGVKRPGREADHSFPSSATIKE
jgi:hypothetical protein